MDSKRVSLVRPDPAPRSACSVLESVEIPDELMELVRQAAARMYPGVAEVFAVPALVRRVIDTAAGAEREAGWEEDGYRLRLPPGRERNVD